GARLSGDLRRRSDLGCAYRASAAIQFATGLGHHRRISGVLDALHRSHPKAQKRICAGLFGDRSKEVWAAILAWIRKERAQEGPQAMPTLFHEQQLITMAKADFLVLDAAETK